MAQFKNLMEIFKLLDKSNCKKCNKPTCLAFAGAVFQGQKNLDDCPVLDKEIIEKYKGKTNNIKTPDQDMEDNIKKLKEQIALIDLSLLAKSQGGTFSDDKLSIFCLGKVVKIDKTGNIITDIHVHPWIAGPVYNYILNGPGTPVSGNWVPLRELKGGKDWGRLFRQRCEKPFKQVADTYTDLFEDMIRLFKGKQVEKHYSSDISLVLHPLPNLPILICYWKPEDGLESDFNIFFDETAEENLNIESIYSLGVGLLTMFEKLSLRHGDL